MTILYYLTKNIITFGYFFKVGQIQFEQNGERKKSNFVCLFRPQEEEDVGVRDVTVKGGSTNAE